MRHIKILKELLNLNRHHISPDMDLALKKLFRVYGGKIDQYTNDPKLTWRIPPGYKVIKAELRNDKGKLICSHKLNPMHLWSYSPSFKGTVSFSVLKKKILVDLNRPDSILFHFRNQYRFTKPNWGFSLNAKQYAMLNKNEKYHVNIQTKFYDAPLKQYISNEPSKKNNLILVAHLDHYCQLNDGLSSAIVNNEVAYELRKKLKNINLCSLNSIEIVGSVYFLNKYKLNSSNTIAAISTNGLSLEGNFKFQLSGKQEAILNKLLKIYSLIYMSKSSIEQFREGWGNDEIAFEVPGINIACGSVHRGPHPTYHSH
jgi:aminopeptidase-like protein